MQLKELIHNGRVFGACEDKVVPMLNKALCHEDLSS
jgi:hypothetical protein